MMLNSQQQLLQQVAWRGINPSLKRLSFFQRSNFELNPTKRMVVEMPPDPMTLGSGRGKTVFLPS